MFINDIEISNLTKPYVIAEMSGNHGNSLENALELMSECASAGAHAFKIQTYTASSLTLQSERPEYIVNSGPWKNRSLFDLYSQGQTPISWLPPLASLAKSLKIAFFSTPFSVDEVSILEDIDVPAYKVASFEINFSQLLIRIAETRKPIIFSTGLASLAEIESAVKLLKEHNSGPIAILKCTTSYPASISDLNLATIPYLINKYDFPIGFSDHTEGATAAIAAVALGARIIEKHVKLDRDTDSVDASFSLPVSGLKDFISVINDSFQSIGVVQNGPTENETPYLRYRRSIVANKNIKKGEIFSAQNISIVRPNIGLEPQKLDGLIGKKASRDIEFAEGINEGMFN
jgi:pseudaminic acid synthase